MRGKLIVAGTQRSFPSLDDLTLRELRLLIGAAKQMSLRDASVWAGGSPTGSNRRMETIFDKLNLVNDPAIARWSNLKLVGAIVLVTLDPLNKGIIPWRGLNVPTR